MSGFIIEGGIYFLILFTPFAFGGVELWAQGVLQIVTGIIVAAWIWNRSGRPAQGPQRLPQRVMWVTIALFVAFVCFQLIPLPPAWIQKLSPGTYDLYAGSLPGYAQGEDFSAARLPAWLLERQATHLAEVAGTGDAAQLPEATPGAGGFPARASSWRSLTIYPFETWQRLKLLLCFAGLYAVTTSWFSRKERLNRLLAMTVFSGFALSLLGIIQKLTWNGKLLWIREGTYGNVFGPYVNRNSYAAFAGTVLPLAVCMAFGAMRRVEQGRQGALSRLLLWVFMTVTIAGGIFYSLSRGGILTAVLSLALVAGLLLYYGRGARDLAVLGLMALAAAGFLVWLGPEQVIERLGTLSGGQGIPSMEARMAAWGRTTDLMASSPVVGTGLGTFRFSFMRFAPPGEGWWTEAHDEYLELLCDTGAIGGLLFVAGFASWLMLVWHPSWFRDRSDRFAFMGGVAGIAGLLIHSTVSSNMQVPANGLLLTLLGAALVCLVDGQSTKKRGRARGDGAMTA